MTDLKRYYSISEVAEIFDVSKSLIRFWETEFDSLRPYKNSKGDRRFTPQNIDQLQQIYDLVKQRGFTLKGAKQEIKLEKVRAKEKAELINILTKIRSNLADLQEQL